jgi:murein DD-endopeptidase MepM/ murein hydrolase activator NlpD
MFARFTERCRALLSRARGLLALLCCLLLLLAGTLMQSAGAFTPHNAQTQFPHIAPFLHLPYYGTETLEQRTTSYFDHDKPWYAADGLFVRYDGKHWRGSSISVLNCDAGKNCYDGHDGYDLNLRFEPVLSAAAGKVMRSGWYNALNHSSSFGLWVAIDHGNGIATAYGHLSALTVWLNEHIGSQWQVGTSGTSGSSTGPHLHFGTYYYPAWRATDPSGWTARSTDPNIVPDHALWTSGTNNAPVPLLSSYGQQTAPGAVLVDDSDPGWTSTGTWHSSHSSSDINGGLHWTQTTSGSATATATWQATVPVSGYYEVGVYVDARHASSGWATYSISSVYHDDQTREIRHQVEVDEEHVGLFQSPFGKVDTHAQWISLGTYYFSNSRPAQVTLTNATGEDGQQIAADGVEFAPLNPPAPPATPTPVASPTPEPVMSPTPDPVMSPTTAKNEALTGYPVRASFYFQKNVIYTKAATPVRSPLVYQHP